VMIDGDVVHTATFGVRVPGTFDRVETVDRFRLASISKVVTAIVTLRLVEAGLLALDEPVGERIAAYVGATPTDPDVAALTPEHLLSHTSGFRQYESIFFGNGAPTCRDAARQGLSNSLNALGGYTYSNMNYCVLSMLIEDVTGMPYEQAAYEWLLTPLGITGMRLAGTYDVGPDEVMHQSAPGRMYMEALGGAGAWIATPTDVARILDSLSDDDDGWHPLSAAMTERMRRPPFDRPAAGGGYGLGLILYPDGSFGHTGTLESTHAMVLSRPDRVTWALMVNGPYPSTTRNLRTIVDRAFAAAFPDG
jgi:D-alanyl-D-alanine carboxypeptidase